MASREKKQDSGIIMDMDKSEKRKGGEEEEEKGVGGESAIQRNSGHAAAAAAAAATAAAEGGSHNSFSGHDSMVAIQLSRAQQEKVALENQLRAAQSKAHLTASLHSQSSARWALSRLVGDVQRWQQKGLLTAVFVWKQFTHFNSDAELYADLQKLKAMVLQK